MLQAMEQNDGETFEYFVTDLHVLIYYCTYQAVSKTNMIHDHIVYRIISMKLHEKMISEGSDLMLYMTDMNTPSVSGEANVKSSSTLCQKQTEDQEKP